VFVSKFLLQVVPCWELEIKLLERFISYLSVYQSFQV